MCPVRSSATFIGLSASLHLVWGWEYQTQEIGSGSPALSTHFRVRATTGTLSSVTATQSMDLGLREFIDVHRVLGNRELSSKGSAHKGSCSDTAQPRTTTYRRNQRSPSPYSRPQIPERGHRQRGSFLSSITVVATTCMWGQKGKLEEAGYRLGRGWRRPGRRRVV